MCLYECIACNIRYKAEARPIPPRCCGYEMRVVYGA